MLNSGDGHELGLTVDRNSLTVTLISLRTALAQLSSTRTTRSTPPAPPPAITTTPAV